MENIFDWQYNTIPGNANQGAILTTRNNITNPPFNQSDFIWKAMEDVIGVANIKLEYDEVLNKYTLYKAKGHLNNNNEWSYNWYVVGTWDALTDIVAESLKNLKYVEYIYDTSIENTLNIKGKLKNGVIEEIVNIHFADSQEINLMQPLQGVATSITQTENGRQINIRYNTNDFTLDNEGNLKSNIISDNNVSNAKTWSSLKIRNNTIARFNFKGKLATPELLPSLVNVDVDTLGNVYWIENESDLYVCIASTSDLSVPAQWFPFTKIYNKEGAIKLQKTSNGLDLIFNFDNEDFTTNNNILKSKIINDTLTSEDATANKHTYSISKITQLITSVMRYKGQVATFNDLPQTGNINGDCYNVLDTGDNYAWNGTSWDNLSGEYIAGAGIVISGKVISATGISFNVGEGLQVNGAGSSAILSTKIGDGLNYDVNGALKIKNGLGITINNAGVNVNTGQTTQITNNLIEVKTQNGLINTNTGVAINANFTIKDSPLGSEASKLALYTDGKIALDFTESAVVITGELLAAENLAIGTNSITTLQVPNLNKYDMIAIEYELNTTYYPKGVSNVRQAVIVPDSLGTAGTAPNGSAIYMLLIRSIDWTNNVFRNCEWWYTRSFGSGIWSPANSTSGGLRYIKVYGMKAK